MRRGGASILAWQRRTGGGGRSLRRWNLPPDATGPSLCPTQDYKVEKTGQLITATKSLSIQKAPRVLVIHLTRYKWWQEGAREIPEQPRRDHYSKPACMRHILRSLICVCVAKLTVSTQAAARWRSPSGYLGS